MAERILISIHGVETDGAWQDKIDPSFEGIDGFAYRKYKYGKFPFYEAVSSKAREEEIQQFSQFYDSLRALEPKSISIIAHSFGTYLVGACLSRFPVYEFDTVILCGSILAQDYDWPGLFQPGRIKRLLNETAGDDWVVNKFRNGFLRNQIPHSGPSGVDGFLNKPAGMIERHFAEFKHSDAFVLREHCNRFWRPFIFNNEEFAALSWRVVEGDDEATVLFRERYGPMVRDLFKKVFPEKSDDAVAERAETILDAMAPEGAHGIYSPKDLAWNIVGELWKAKQRAEK
jgi:pimeloyl-ACP methyl ester carboxylesterase